MRSKEDEGEKWKRFELKDLDKGDKYRYWHGIVGKYLGFNYSIRPKWQMQKHFLYRLQRVITWISDKSKKKITNHI